MSERPSRQDLVVTPPTSNLRFVVTAVACAGAGFACVWGGLAVRSRLRADGASEPVPAMAGDIATAPGADRADEAPERFPDAPAADVERRAMAADEPSAPLADRYTHRQTSFREPETAVPVAAADPASRFGSPPAPEPFDEGRAASTDGVEEPTGVILAGTEIAAGARGLADPGDELPFDSQPPAGPDDLGATDFADGSADSVPFPPDETAAPDDLPEDRGDLEVDPRATADGGAARGGWGDPSAEPSPTDSALPPPVPPAAVKPFNPFAAAPLPPAASPPPVPPAPPGGASGGPATVAWYDTPARAAADPDAPVPVDQGGRRTAPPPAGMPFAAAPPLGPPPTSDPGLPEPRSAPSPPATGQGRPGAIHLEGVQTPQLAVEKRGPREIQVGKTARFEILVRNVGSAQANDVVLRDSVPAGTALVATTPPAAPAGPGSAPGDLVWLLGTLPPGGQTRVGIDLMPMTEGDVGSVASVSFRADASVRARATRPALQIVAQTPAPVLVGGESKLTITVSNPGSGVATGVVLEGLLPDGLSHRAGRELEFDVGALPPGESRSIDLVLATTGPGAHGLRLVARADGQIEVAETVRVAVTAPTLDVAVQMPSRRFLQRPATCTIAMNNAGTAPAVGVELAAQLPPGLKFVRANNAGYYEERTHRVLWNLEELPAAETGEVEVVLMPVALGPQKIVAAARTTAGLSDQATHTVEVEGLAALSFEVADSEDPIEIGGVSEYVVRVVNQGTKPASGVRVVATLLGDMEPVEARGPSPHRVDNLTVAFEPLAKLAPSEEALYRIRVRGRREGDQRVQVQLTSDEQPAPISREETTRVYADR